MQRPPTPRAQSQGSLEVLFAPLPAPLSTSVGSLPCMWTDSQKCCEEGSGHPKMHGQPVTMVPCPAPPQSRATAPHGSAPGARVSPVAALATPVSVKRAGPSRHHGRQSRGRAGRSLLHAAGRGRQVLQRLPASGLDTAELLVPQRGTWRGAEVLTASTCPGAEPTHSWARSPTQSTGAQLGPQPNLSLEHRENGEWPLARGRTASGFLHHGTLTVDVCS